MGERRSARVGTVSGLALLAGGTAIAAVAGGAHSIFATILLGMLTVGMGHALLEEIRRQARRSMAGWAARDTINAVLLAAWAAGALITTVLAVTPASVRVVGLGLSLGYALSCAYFVLERRRTLTATPPPPIAEPLSAAEPILAAEPIPSAGPNGAAGPNSAAGPISGLDFVAGPISEPIRGGGARSSADPGGRAGFSAQPGTHVGP